MADAGCQCLRRRLRRCLVLDGVADPGVGPGRRARRDLGSGLSGHEEPPVSGVANSVAAVRAGAKQIDGSCRRFGGAGNAPVEARSGCSARSASRPALISSTLPTPPGRGAPGHAGRVSARPQRVDHSGVYSSFLKHAVRQAESATACRRQRCCTGPVSAKIIGGQEDQLIDIAGNQTRAG